MFYVSPGCCRKWSEYEKRIATLEFDRDRKSMGVIANSHFGKKSLLVKVFLLFLHLLIWMTFNYKTYTDFENQMWNAVLHSYKWPNGAQFYIFIPFYGWVKAENIEGSFLSKDILFALLDF